MVSPRNYPQRIWFAVRVVLAVACDLSLAGLHRAGIVRTMNKSQSASTAKRSRLSWYSRSAQTTVRLMLIALIIGWLGLSLTLRPTHQTRQATASVAKFDQAAQAPDSFSFSEIGAKATADYKGDAVGITSTAEGAELRTGFQKLRAEVNREGLLLQSTEKAGGELQLSATAVGRETGAEVRLPATGEVRVREKVVVFNRPGLTEEFSVSADGVRQDFLLAERPAGEGELFVELALSGAQAQRGASGARLRLAGSMRQLAYDRLQVTDATGRELEARLEVVTAERLSIHVADAGAVYPVRIDPTFSDADWVSLNPGFPGANGAILAFAVDGNGNLYVAGAFTVFGSLGANRIVKWNGSTWSALGSGTDHNINALAVIGSDLYAGGIFTNAGGVLANGIAKWDGSAWSALGSGVSNGFSSTVNALAVIGSDLYAGGIFTTAGGVSAKGIAKWDGSAWSALGSGVDWVKALAVIGSDLYVGGVFSTAGGVTANNVARWNGSAWSALGSGLNSVVNTLAVSGANLYAGGAFTMTGATTVNRIARWNGSAWSALGSGLNNTVNALAVIGSDLYAGGDFTVAGVVGASRIAKWNGSAWSAVGTGLNNTVNALGVFGSDLYAGGSFTNAGGVAANYIAKWDGSAWSALGSGMNNAVSALAVIGSDLYVGGQFNTASGITASRIAKWNGSIWSALGSGMDGQVKALAVIGSDLYAGGEFNSAGGVAASGIAKWNGSAWSALDSGVAGWVNALAVSGNDLYAAGWFNTAGSVSANRIAKWNGSAWSALGSGINNGSGVNALAVIGDDLYAGGQFSMAGGMAANNIAKWNGSAWSALGSGTDPTVNALAVIGGDLYAGGSFFSAGGMTVLRIAKWNGSVWSALGSGVSGTVLALAVSGGDLYVGGNFIQEGSFGIAKWDGSAWSGLGSGTNQGVLALATDSSGHLFVGGLFSYVGGTTLSPYIAQYNFSTNTPPIISTAAFSPLPRQQGAVASNATIASVSDAETAWGSLTVTATTVPTGISVTNIVNSNGAVTADIAADCSATLGNHTVILEVSDGIQTATANLTVTVADTITPTLGACPINITQAPAAGACGAAVSFTNPSATDNCGTPTVTCTPASGTNFPIGTTTVSCVATDAANNPSAPCSFTVTVTASAPPVLSYSSPQMAIPGQSLTINPATGPSDDEGIQSIVVQDVTLNAPTPVTVTVDNTTGAVTVPSNMPSGSYTVTIRATDNCGSFTDAIFTLDVGCIAITVNPPTLPNGFVGSSYNQALSATGGTPGYTFSLDSGTFPPGLGIVGTNLTGTPTTTGVFTFTIKATDSGGTCFGTQAYTVVISGTGLQFYPLAHPVRLLDTRVGAAACQTPGAQINGGNPLTVPARGTCGAQTIPANAAAVTGNVTTVGPAANGFLTIYPSTFAQPSASNSNYQAGQTLNNVFTVGLGAADGAFKIYSVQTTDVIVDITGYFAPPEAANPGGLFFHPLPVPVRLLDTRVMQTACTTPETPVLAGTEVSQQGNAICGIPGSAVALVGNAITVGPAAQGFLTLFASNETRPLIASGNYQIGQTLNSPFTVRLSPSGNFTLYSLQQTDLVIDVLGYYSAEPSDTTGIGLLFSPLTSTRLLDTRPLQPACFMPGAAIPAATETSQAARGTCGIPATAKAIVGNATTVSPAALGFLTFWPSDVSRPNAATSNYAAGVNFNRHYTVGLGTDGAFKLYALTSTHLVIDVSGSFAP